MRRQWLGIAFVALGAGTAFAGPPRKVAAVEGIAEYALDNGMKALLFPDQSRPTVTVSLTVFVGSKHEGYGETGMAHLLEHMVFKGTPTHPRVPKALQDRGASFNGTTSLDRTNYFETLPAGDGNLEFALRLEADRFVNSLIRREDLLTEFSVVRNEFERGENSPTAILGQRMIAAAFEWHNYGKSTIGNRTDIERVPVDRLQAFYRKHYQPDNAMVVVAGKFDEATALALVEKTFGAIPRPARELEVPYTEEPPQDGERLVTLRRVGNGGAVGMVFHVPAGSHPDFPALQVADRILSAPPAGRLYKALVETKKATSASANAQGCRDPGFLEVLAEVADPAGLEEVRDLILKELDTLATEGPTAAEVARAKARFAAERERAATNTSGIAVGLSNWAGQGDWRLYFWNRDQLEKVAAADVQRVAKKYFVRSNRTVGMFLPTKTPERAAIPAAPDVAALLKDYRGRAAVSEGEAFDPSPGEIEKRVIRTTLPEGTKVVLLPKKTRGGTVDLALSLHYGSPDRMAGQEAVAGLMGSLIGVATKKLDRQELQDALEQAKTTLGGGGGGRRGGGGPPAAGGAGTYGTALSTRRENLPAALGLLKQILREPSFPADELARMKTQRLAMMKRLQYEPQALAGDWLARKLAPYPPADPRYVPTREEQAARLQAVERGRIVKLYESELGASHAEIALVGDFDPKEALPLLAEVVAGWRSPQPYVRLDRPVPPGLKGDSATFRTPDKANAFYLAGALLEIRDDDPDYAALQVANFIFGAGALSSRLGDRLRQKEGWSYGAGSGLTADAVDRRAAWSLNAISNPENAPKVVKAVREELDRLRKDGATAAEVEAAKKSILQGAKLQRSNDGALARRLAGLERLGRTMAFDAEQETRIAALTAERVNYALRQHFDPAKLAVASAGDFAEDGK